MICSLVILLASHQDIGGFKKTQALDIVRNLVRTIWTRDGQRQRLAGAFDDRLVIVADELRQNWVTAHVGGSVYAIFDRTTGGLRSLGISRDLEDQAVRDQTRGDGISREEAQSAFDEYWNVLNPGVKTKIFMFKRVGKEWEIQGLPDVGDTMLLSDYSFLVRLDADRGQLLTLSQRTLPDLSLKSANCVSQQLGLDAALDAYSRFQPFAHGRIGLTWKSLGVPSFSKPNEMTEEHLGFARENKAIPLYVTHIEDAEAVNDMGECWRWQDVYVDARDGRPTAIMPDSMLGATSGEPKRVLPSFQSPVQLLGIDQKVADFALGKPRRVCADIEKQSRLLLRQGKQLWSVQACAKHSRLSVMGHSFEISKKVGYAIKGRKPSKVFGTGS